MVMWAMWAAPLEIAADIRNISAASAAILKHEGIIAVNQDPLMYQGRRVSNDGGLQVWQKQLVGGSVAVALLNAGNTSAPIGLTFEDVGFSSCDRVRVWDILQRADLGVHVGGLHHPHSPIAAHGVSLLNLTWAP